MTTSFGAVLEEFEVRDALANVLHNELDMDMMMYEMKPENF